MSAADFPRSLSLVLVSEGGYVNDRRDSGGATNRGITQRVYDAFRRLSAKFPQSVRLITDDEVSAIYRRQYWAAICGDDLPPGVDYAVFDAAVNSGPGQAALWLQRALRVTADGHIGLVTLHTAQTTSDRAALIQSICAQRLTFLQHLRNWVTFGHGWSNRLKSVQANALAMAG